ncbi:conjugal transfer protein TraF [Alteraurantiacibacter buctensis]|uniref:Conjugal transfer protein TraF n=1 Tax=Alteraurantiacibacter buctensis TaxID=1503981 RepID=A0A844Z057_9SPHN|nr:conjugal transfer protein TraF [Alteraurantiacibacter buctensis]MXO72094.1 conjugal transfer protein TraF [Alteraurantiacibacter buctensis]
MPAPASKAAWRLLAACAIANAVSLSSPALAQSTATRADAPPSALSAERPDSFYCEERRLGYWFYCERPKPPEQNTPAPAPAASATNQLDAITATLRELKAKAILEPTPANVTAYIRFQRAQLDRASLFSDVWQRAIWQDPELDYTLQRPVSTLGKRQWQDSRTAERNAAMAQLSERYGLFYFFAQSCGACEVMSPIVQSVASTWHIAVRAISTDGGPSRHFPNYTVETNQRSRMGLEPKVTPAVVLWDAETGRPIPIGYGVMSADELQDRIYLLTSKEAGRDY